MSDVIDAVARDWRPSRAESRHAIRNAIALAAQAENGLVHAATVRRYLPSWVDSASIGAVVCTLVRQGALVGTGEFRANGGGSRNRTKPSEVRRLVAPLGVDA